MGSHGYILRLRDISVLRNEGPTAEVMLTRQSMQEWLKENKGKTCKYFGRSKPLYAVLNGMALNGKVIICYEEDGQAKTLTVPRSKIKICESDPGPEQVE